MRKFLRKSPGLLILATAAVALALIACFFFSQKGVTFADRTVAEWSEALDRAPDSAKKRLRAGGAKAVPVLTELLEVESGSRATSAAEVLYQLAPEVASALPPLIAARRHVSLGVRYWVIRALERVAHVDEEVVAALVEALKDPSVPIRQRAAGALGNLGPTARRALPDLEQSLEDRNEIVRITAAGALLRLDRGQTKARRFLLEETGGQSPSEFRCYALAMLGSLGTVIADAAPQIQALLDDPDPKVRRRAADVLKQMQKPPANQVNPTATTMRRHPLPFPIKQ
jgi:HEAT repeat protein